MSHAWNAERKRVLILLESTYGANATPHGDVSYWIETGKDATFNRLYRVLGAGKSRAAFAAQFTLDNVADAPVGLTNKSKATPAQLRAGAATLPERLRVLAPRAVWLATVRARAYALPVIERARVPVVVTKHPLYTINISADELRDAWARVSQLGGP